MLARDNVNPFAATDVDRARLGSGESQVSIAALGGSSGIILAWKAATFDQSETWLGRHVVATCLVNRIDDIAIVMASAYNPWASTLQGKLSEDLVQLCEAFPDTPILIDGDYNVTLAAEDRPNRARDATQDRPSNRKS